MKYLSSTRRSRKTLACSRKGTTAVEFSLVFPIILTFFVAMTVFTQAFTMRDTAQHAAYEGAREALKLESNTDDCKKRTIEFLNAMKLRGASIKIEPSVLSAETKEVAVTVSIPFSQNAWIGGGFIPNDWNATSRVSLNRYYRDE